MTDQHQRRDAVDPARSVIVQAPAGSGKTTLLVERYLGLLAVVEAPEEILAITFTRKAAAEMKQRILRYLDPAFDTDAPHEQDALASARAVRDKVANWGLRENPHRLLIRTIDSFNHYLARTMPVASALGPVPAPADNTQALYRQAARRVLERLEQGDGLAADLERVLAWRDHRSQDVEDLLAAMLAKREQWLRAFGVAGSHERERLEAVLAAEVTRQLERAAAALDKALDAAGCAPPDLLALLQFAGRNLCDAGKTSPVCAFVDADRLPEPVPEDLPLWRGLGELLLTGRGTVRRRLDKNDGFPPGCAEKAGCLELLGAMPDETGFAPLLHRARALPEPRYDDGDWHTLDALIRVLRHAAAELAVVFAGTGQTDFTGLAAAALRGLGDEERGFTDLGLYLDRRIRHILVDEFQDTNWSQLHLLEKLTAGWAGEHMPACGSGNCGSGNCGSGLQTATRSSETLVGDPRTATRTLFLVGDPMQSIYRFREAEVGLFIRSRDRGIGGVALESKRLSRNFRSRTEIVDWVNDHLGPIFPDDEDIAAGAVAYARSEAGREPGGRVDVLARPDERSEADAVVDLVQQSLAAHADDPGFKAAIIVRARTHLREILPALQRRGVPFRAVKLDPLVTRPVVQDLLALTRCVTQPADTAALLAVLRSPVCGLTLHDLHRLAGDGRSPYDDAALARLEGDARRRAARVLEALDDARRHRQRRPVRALVEGLWHRLGGPACGASPRTDGQDAEAFLALLDTAEREHLLDDWNDFLELLEGGHTAGDPPSDDVKLEILTMHGAKGLEWDLVVLPNLNKGTGRDDSELLHWLPFTGPEGNEQVLFAPLRAASQPKNPPLVDMIREERKARAAYENQRLLYVAATRGREHLVLSACLAPSGKGEVAPTSGSLLAHLWPTVEEAFVAALMDAPAATDGPPAAPGRDQTLRRVASGWEAPMAPAFHWRPALPPREREIDVEFNWAGLDARRIGTVLHRLLERVGRLGIERLTDLQRERLLARIPLLLRSMGSRGATLDEAAAVVRGAFENTLASPTGRWLLSNRHRDPACELAVSGVVDGQLVNAVVDRTFVDADGVRWIIDYKSGYRAGGDLEGFLVQEAERYRAQLESYRRLFRQMGEQHVRAALYLPRHDRLQEVPGSTTP